MSSGESNVHAERMLNGFGLGARFKRSSDVLSVVMCKLKLVSSRKRKTKREVKASGANPAETSRLPGRCKGRVCVAPSRAITFHTLRTIVVTRQTSRSLPWPRPLYDFLLLQNTPTRHVHPVVQHRARTRPVLPMLLKQPKSTIRLRYVYAETTSWV